MAAEMTQRGRCQVCDRPVGLRSDGTARSHLAHPGGPRCIGTGSEALDRDLPRGACDHCGRDISLLLPNGVVGHHLYQGSRCDGAGRLPRGGLDPVGMIYLAELTANLQRHIEERAAELAAPQIAAAEKAAADRVSETEAELTATRQRSRDLEAELRRQMTAVERNSGRARSQALRAASRDLALLDHADGCPGRASGCTCQLASVYEWLVARAERARAEEDQ